MLKGQFLPGRPSRVGLTRGNPLRMCIHDPPGPRRAFLKGGDVSTRTVSFFLVSSQKISLKVLLSVGRRAPCSKKKPHPLWRTQFWFSKTSDNQYIQICQLEKDTQKGHRKFVFFLSAVSTVRQTKSTVWIIHVLV